MLGYETRLLAQESLFGALSLAQARPSSQRGLPRRRVPRSGAQTRAAYRACCSSGVGGRRAPGGRLAAFGQVRRLERSARARLALPALPRLEPWLLAGLTRACSRRAARRTSAALACPRAQTQGCARTPCARSARLKRTVRPRYHSSCAVRQKGVASALSNDAENTQKSVPAQVRRRGRSSLFQSAAWTGAATRLSCLAQSWRVQPGVSQSVGGGHVYGAS